MLCCLCSVSENIAMAQEYDVIIELDSEGYFVATVPALKGCHTQARSLDELMHRVKEAIALCLEVEEQNLLTSKWVEVSEPAQLARCLQPICHRVTTID